MIPDNACTLRITAAAGTELAGAYSDGTLKPPRMGVIVPVQKKFTTLSAFILHAACWIRLAPIVQYSLLLPPVGVGSVSQYPCGGHALTPPTDRRLGRPLPYQLANQTHTDLRV